MTIRTRNIADSAITTAKIADLTVTATSLDASAFTAAKLASSLTTGFIPLPLTSWRAIATNDIPNIAGTPAAGRLTSDTAPALKRVNAATDKKMRIQWAASGVIEIAQSIVTPQDLDDTAAIVFHMRAAMAGASDTPTVAVGYFEGVGDTNAGGNTGAVTGTAVAEYTVTIAAGDVGVAPKSVQINLVPAAHGTDALYVYATWLTYTKLLA